MWDEWHRDNAHASHRDHADEARKRFMHALPQTGPCTVLELGCGQGRDAIEMAESGISVVGIDLSQVAINRAIRNATSSGADIRLLRHDVSEPLPFDDAQFDGVYAHLSLHYFNDSTTQAIIDEVYRALRPGGVLYFTVRSVRDTLAHDLKSQPLDDGDSGDRRCFDGHIRRFLDTAFIKSVLADWCVHEQDVREYVNYKNHTNPGHFIEVLARRPAADDVGFVRPRYPLALLTSSNIAT